MQTHSNPALDLPSPIKAYFAADTADARAVALCFSEGAVVIDEQHEHRGRAAIARWKAAATAKYHYISVPIAVDVSEADVIVTARLTGNFPGSPVDLRYRFTVDGDTISRLEIAP